MFLPNTLLSDILTLDVVGTRATTIPLATHPPHSKADPASLFPRKGPTLFLRISPQNT